MLQEVFKMMDEYHTVYTVQCFCAIYIELIEQNNEYAVVAKIESCFEDLRSKQFQWEKETFPVKWGLNKDTC